jgi:hypothetical protein
MSVMPSDMASGAAGAPLPQNVASRLQQSEETDRSSLRRSTGPMAENAAGIGETARQPSVLDREADGRMWWNWPGQDEADEAAGSPGPPAARPESNPPAAGPQWPLGEYHDRQAPPPEEAGQRIDVQA